MAQKPNDEKDYKLPGLSLERFEAAVTAVVALRDAGKLFLFLGRRSSIRVITDPSAFRKAFVSALEGAEASEEEARKALAEVRNCAAVYAGFRDVNRVVEMLSETVYAREFDKLPKAEKAAFKKQQRAKVRLVSEKLCMDALRSREERLRTVTAPSIEGLDFELVGEREDSLMETNITEPFLRFRLRYSSPRADGPFSFLFGFPWGPPQYPIDSFEFDGDESDIDLLITRLTRAKEAPFLEAKEKASKKSDA